MYLWILTAVFLASAAGLIWLLCRIRRQGRSPGSIAGLVLTTAIAAAAGVLVLLGMLLAGNRQSQPPETEPAAVPTAETTAPRPLPTTEATEPEAPTLPEDFDLPVSQVPEALPDPNGIAQLQYEDCPRFETSVELSRYLLNRFLNGQFKLDFFMSRELAPGEGEGTHQVHNCILAALSYYPFGAYNVYSLYPEEVGEPDWVLMHLELRYENPAYDLEARAEALEYVLRHPVPEGGFSDADEEREYCRGIHDYLIERISYDPIGYDPMDMLNSSDYDNKQEAYNVLVSEDTSAVCAGYARGFTLIAQYAGIDCAYAVGNEDGQDLQSHAWNVVYPCDGSRPVLVDVTWDDRDLTDGDGNAICFYDYFYIPLDEEYEHALHWETELFLSYLHP